ASFPRSRETPRIVKFLSLYLLKTLTRFGFSTRHGPHQEAQKSSSTYFPLKSESFTGFPEGSFCVKSAAIEPTAVYLFLFRTAANACPEPVWRSFSFKPLNNGSISE